MKMKQLIYFSSPNEVMTGRCNLGPLRSLIATSAKNNKKNSITSVFIVDRAAIIQCIEGPSLHVDDLFDQILCDDRHHDIKVIDETVISRRNFPGDHMKLLHPLGSYFSEADIDEHNLQKSCLIRETICNKLRKIHLSQPLTGALKRMP